MKYAYTWVSICILTFALVHGGAWWASSASDQEALRIKGHAQSGIELKRVQVAEVGAQVVYRAPQPPGPVTLHAAGRGLPHVTYADASDLTDVGGGPAAGVLQSQAVIARSVATADLDGDHANDVITGFLGSTGGLVTVRRGHRDGTFEPPMSYPVDLVPDELVTGDFDGDRRPDIVVAQSGVKALLFLPGRGDGRFGPSTWIDLEGRPGALLAADFGRPSGHEDLFVAVDDEGGARLLFWHGEHGALRATPQVIALPSTAVALAAGHLTDDGSPDLVVATVDQLLIFAGPGLVEGQQTVTRVGKRSRQALSTRWDRHHTADFHTEGARFDSAGFTLIHRATLGARPVALTVGDFDGDRWSDIALLDAANRQIMLYRNRDGRMGEPLLHPIDGRPVTMIASNVNGDANMDLVLVDEANSHLDIVLGRAGGRFDAPVRLDVDSHPTLVFSARFMRKAQEGLVVLKKKRGTTVLALPMVTGDITVDTLTDEFCHPGQGGCTDTGTSLREALFAANIVAGPNTIHFTTGIGTILITDGTGGALPALTDTTGPTTLEGAGITLDGIGCTSCNGLKISSDGNTVNDLTVQNFEADGISIDPSNTNMIDGCTLSGNRDGLHVDGDDNVVMSCSSGGNNRDGYLVAGGMGNQFTSSDATNNDGDGYEIQSDNNTVESSTITGNGGNGVLIIGGVGNTIMNNTAISDNDDDGVDIGAVVLLTARRTPSTGGANDRGVHQLNGVAGNLVDNNVIANNNGGDPEFDGGGGVLIHFDADGNTVRNNQITDNTGSGVRIETSQNTVEFNTITGNTDDGVIVGSFSGQVPAFASALLPTRLAVVVASPTANRISQNAINNNGALGIDLDDDGVTANDADDPDAGANNLQNFPVILSACDNGGTVLVDFSIDSSVANATYPLTIEFFLNMGCDGSGNGEGEAFVASTTVDGPGTAMGIVLPGAIAGDVVTATATDADGNTSEFSACVTVTADTTPPSLTCPSDVTVECDVDRTDPTNTGGSATASDDCDPNPTVTFTDDESGLTDCDGTGVVIRTWTATDASGNQASCTQTITVVDTTAPTMSCPEDIVVECTSSAGAAVPFTVTVTDNCDPDPVVACVDQDDNPVQSGDVFPLGTTEVTCTATDACGNQTSCTFTITVVERRSVLQDDRNGNCLQLGICGNGGNFTWKLPDGTLIVGTVTLTVNGEVINITGTGSNGEILQGGVNVLLRRGTARISTAQGQPLAGITDTNIDDNDPCP